MATPPTGLLGPPFFPTLPPGLAPSSGGLLLGELLTEVQGVCVAFDSSAFDPSPVWQRLDDPAGPFAVTGYRISRGRRYETDRTDTGTATITLVDTTGVFDPTDTDSPFYGQLLPRKQAAIALQNPVNDTWHTIFRGFVTSWRFEPHVTQSLQYVTIELVDALAILAATELVPNGSFGDAVVDGNIVYAENATTGAVRTRIVRVLDQVGWPGALGAATDILRDIFSGNVKLQETVYAPRSSALSVIQDAADAEFPAVANVYPAKAGAVTFHGRYARFNFEDANYGINEWFVGDVSAVESDPETTVPAVPPFVFYIDDGNVFTSAIALPQNVSDSAIQGQYVTDDPAVEEYGLQTWSSENLLTLGGEGGTTALQETHLFAEYVVNNTSTPRVRLEAITIKGQTPSGISGSASWQLLCNVEISDVVTVFTNPDWTGANFSAGFDLSFYVEGIGYEVRPMTDSHPEVTLTLDLSPQALYDVNPFLG